MDHKRDGPFKVGDRVNLVWVGWNGIKYPGTVIAYKKKDGRQCVKLDGRAGGSGPGGSYSIGDHVTATLINPSTEPQAQEADIEFKVGDRVRHLGCFTGTIVDVLVSEYSGQTIHVRRDDGQQGSGLDGTWICSVEKLTLISSTEPQAQEETRMKAYQWVIWNVDEKGTRLSIAEQSQAMAAYASVEAAKMSIWAMFAGDGSDGTSTNITDYEVVVHPFGG